MTKWNITADKLPSDEDKWVLGKFGPGLYCTVKYMKDYGRWQNFNHTWIRVPAKWRKLKDE